MPMKGIYWDVGEFLKYASPWCTDRRIIDDLGKKFGDYNREEPVPDLAVKYLDQVEELWSIRENIIDQKEVNQSGEVHADSFKKAYIKSYQKAVLDLRDKILENIGMYKKTYKKLSIPKQKRKEYISRFC
jgi:hypothetical protein